MCRKINFKKTTVTDAPAFRPRIPLRALCEFILYGAVLFWGCLMPYLGLRVDLIYLANHTNPAVRAGRGIIFIVFKQISGTMLKLATSKLRVPFFRLHAGLVAAANRGLVLPLTVVQSRSWTSVGFFLATDWVAWGFRLMSAIPLFEGALQSEDSVGKPRSDSKFRKLALFTKYIRETINSYHVSPPHGMSTVKSRMAFAEYESVVTTVGVFAVAIVFPFAYGLKEIAAAHPNNKAESVAV